MKIPKSFRPEKNLEEKTHELIEGNIQKVDNELLFDPNEPKNKIVEYAEFKAKDLDNFPFNPNCLKEFVIRYNSPDKRTYKLSSGLNYGAIERKYEENRICSYMTFLESEGKFKRIADSYRLFKFTNKIAKATGNSKIRIPMIRHSEHLKNTLIEFFNKWLYSDLNTLKKISKSLESEGGYVMIQSISFYGISESQIDFCQMKPSKHLTTYNKIVPPC